MSKTATVRLASRIRLREGDAPDVHENGYGSPAHVAETNATQPETQDNQEAPIRILGRRVVRY